MATGIPKTQSNGHIDTFIQGSYSRSTAVRLEYDGKQPEIDILTILPSNTVTLYDCQDNSDNRLYYGNNLSILASLMNNSSVRGRVKLIYIDPPFSTKGVFQSRKQQDAYSDLLAGAPYIEFIRERLI